MADLPREISVEIPVEGDWPSSEDMDARNAVIDALDEIGIGEFMGAGGGMGSMDFCYRVSNADAARQAVEEAMSRHLPNREFTLEVSDGATDSTQSGDSVPTSRCYLHDKCGQATEVDGGDFKNIATPVPGMRGTMCTHCGGMFLLGEFRWADTNEPILDYYERYRAHVPAIIKLLCGRRLSLLVLLLGFASGIGFGIWCGGRLGWFWGIAIGVVATIVGAIATILIWDAITDRLLNKTLGVADARCLK